METSPPLSDDLLIGAEAIAMFLYGREDRTARANVYRNVLGLTFFKHGGFKAARKSTIRTELAEIENKARKASEAGEAA
jgi:hypothetical protein